MIRALLALLLMLPVAASAGERAVDRVDPFIGTDGTGHTSPAATRPFGMVAPGPDNADSGWDFTSGYQYRASEILGFSQTRASGTGIPELGDILLQPMATPRADGFASDYHKTSEAARPGYYSVKLVRNGARVELTATARVALHRYTFDADGRVWVLADFQHRLRFLEGPRVTASDVVPRADGIDGTVSSTNWTTRTVAFALRFDRPVAETRLLPPRPGDKAPRYLLGFDLGAGRILRAKIALSTTDVPGARRNLTELDGWDFDRIAAAASTEWNDLLGRATIDAGATTQRIFTTALYHAFLHPSVISDIDGRYRGPDGRIAVARGKLYYSTLSLWDTFRAAHPLYTLLVPERVDDFVLTMLDHARAAGTLPLWTIWGGETNTMIGTPALPVIADAWAKGFRGFDGREALGAMVASSTRNHAQSDWDLFDQRGYYPFDRVPNEAVSRSLEAGVGDDATARMAAMLADPAGTRFARRAGSYTLLIDPDTRLARGRDSEGQWRSPFDPLLVTSPLGTPGDYTEANAWQYSWTPALHDPAGLIAAMGGKTRFTAMLDRFFSLPGKEDKFQGQEALIGQYSHGNEPGHHVAWLYSYSNTPARGAALVRDIATRFYRATPDGLIGNDDAGQMSAWYVFATLGFYPAQPASGRYVAGLPLVERATLRVPGKPVLKIRRNGSGGALRSVRIGDSRLDPLAVPHAAFTQGGTIVFDTREGGGR
ncbi:MAG: GH92 family glycosyl hydrolase [Sphingomonadaceae bacterium]